MHGVVILHPSVDEFERCRGVGDWADPDGIALKGFHKGLGQTIPLLSGLSTGVKQATRLSAVAISIVRWAVKIEPLSDSHCTACGARILPSRCSTQRTIMSRIISPEMPAVVATQLITSRSW